MHKPAILALADGNIFRGIAIGALGHTVGEVVFNTSMTGYQEILTDPSYYQQVVTLTYPHIGNVGTNGHDFESDKAWAAGLIIRDLPLSTSSWRNEQRLTEFLQAQQVVAIAEIDTRRLTRILREKGAQHGCIMAGEIDESFALNKAKEFSGLANMDLARVVSTKQPFEWHEGSWQSNLAVKSKQSNHVVVYDFGVKRNILRLLVDQGCKVTVVPAQASAEEVLKLKPSGIVLSNGPGDPAACDYAIENTKKLLEKNIPIFGICLGHQLLGLACGAKTIKLKFGHHGANHPVQDLVSKRVMISSQNHGFAVDETSLPDFLQATHRSLFDNTLQGIRHTTKPVFSFQGHPEAGPGPEDIGHLFAQFVEMMNSH